MPLIALEAVLGLLIGLTLGLLGGGGSILTVPALVYLIGQTPQAAVTASLVIVGANSAMGAFFHRAQGTLNWRVALVFGGSGMGVAYLAAGLSKHFSATALMIAFSALMLIVGIIMITRKHVADAPHPSRGLLVTALAGAGVGLLTGFLGVGGGFLIVPALVMLVGLPMREAVGTSLVVIAMNSLAGLLGHLGGQLPDLTLLLIFIGSGVVGTLIGSRLAKHIPPSRLRVAFAVFVIGLAVLLLLDNLYKLI